MPNATCNYNDWAGDDLVEPCIPKVKSGWTTIVNAELQINRDEFSSLVRDLASGRDSLLDLLRDVEALDLLAEVADLVLDPLLDGEPAEDLPDFVIDVDGSLAADAVPVLGAVPLWRFLIVPTSISM